jgi:hypothetical protein
VVEADSFGTGSMVNPFPPVQGQAQGDDYRVALGLGACVL